VLDAVKIELARDGVNYSEVIAASVMNSGATAGTFAWTVTGPWSRQAKIRVSGLNGAVSENRAVAFKIQ
jgi:hypothetical protein